MERADGAGFYDGTDDHQCLTPPRLGNIEDCVRPATWKTRVPDTAFKQMDAAYAFGRLHRVAVHEA